MQRSVCRRKAFSLVEMVVVILIIGILASIAVPRYFDQVARAHDQSQKIRLMMIRDALDRYLAENDRQLPAVSTAADLRNIVGPYLRDGFPPVEVGPAADSPTAAIDIDIVHSGGDINGVASPTKGWRYNADTGQFIINYSAATHLEPSVTYDEW
jgi:general secretion pathway protein G